MRRMDVEVLWLLDLVQGSDNILEPLNQDAAIKINAIKAFGDLNISILQPIDSEGVIVMD